MRLIMIINMETSLDPLISASNIYPVCPQLQQGQHCLPFFNKLRQLTRGMRWVMSMVISTTKKTQMLSSDQS
jgi:hypothetical protein